MDLPHDVGVVGSNLAFDLITQTSNVKEQSRSVLKENIFGTFLPRAWSSKAAFFKIFRHVKLLALKTRLQAHIFFTIFITEIDTNTIYLY